DSDLDEGKTNCSDSGFAPTSDKTSDNESDASLSARISPSNVKKKRKDLKHHDSCCAEGFIKTERSQVSALSVSPSSGQPSDIAKLYANSVTPSTHLLQSALSCNSSGPLTTNQATPSHKMLASQPVESMECKPPLALSWSSGANRTNSTPTLE